MPAAGELRVRKHYQHVARVLEVRDELSQINPLWINDRLDQLRQARLAAISPNSSALHYEVGVLQHDGFRWSFLQVQHLAVCRFVNACLVLFENVIERGVTDRTVTFIQNVRRNSELEKAAISPLGDRPVRGRFVGELHEVCRHD